MEAGNCPCIKLVKVLLKKLQNDLFKVLYVPWITAYIYVVQFHVITDWFNALFPLNWLIVFGLVCVTAYLLRVIVNVFL